MMYPPYLLSTGLSFPKGQEGVGSQIRKNRSKNAGGGVGGGVGGGGWGVGEWDGYAQEGKKKGGWLSEKSRGGRLRAWNI